MPIGDFHSQYKYKPIASHYLAQKKMPDVSRSLLGSPYSSDPFPPSKAKKVIYPTPK
jgi:hypothetical protein